MKLTSRKSQLRGAARMPGSKSHTIRAVAISSLAGGVSTIRAPLVSADSKAAVLAYRMFGADIDDSAANWKVTGVSGKPRAGGKIDTLNSGTTLYVAMTTAALASGKTEMTGDEQIQARPATNLIDALNGLGAKVSSLRGNGCAPLIIVGPMCGGKIAIECPTSQYLTSLLLGCPLADGDTEIKVPLLYEQPYVEMTLAWLARQKIKIERDGLQWFKIKGGQKYHPFDEAVPADFSSATFFLVAACLTNSKLALEGLDMSDSQGDKAVIDYLKQMGAKIETGADKTITVWADGLKGCELDLNATPDALPAMSVAACFADGETKLANVPQARLKETDRIAVMAKELTSLGARVKELPDGLVIQGGGLKGGSAGGHGDHRVVMAMAVAGLVSQKPITVDTAEAIEVTFPNFVELMRQLGANIEVKI